MKKRPLPIGVEITADTVKMAQMAVNDGRVRLAAAGCQTLSGDIEAYSGHWQRCAIEAVKSICSTAKFTSKQICTVIPSADVFSKEMRLKIPDGRQAEEFLDSQSAALLPFAPEGALVKHIILNSRKKSAEKNILAVAAEKFKVERYLAIFEKTALNIKTVSVWPAILVSSYVKFFARRKTDADTVTLLISPSAGNSNIVICRNYDILFARGIQYGTSIFENDDGKEKFISQLEGCINYFQNTDRSSCIERILLMSSDKSCEKMTAAVSAVAEKHSLCAFTANVINAVGENTFSFGIDSRDIRQDWTTVFGLSLLADLQEAV